ncbi:hypothetical protein, partial [Sinorhizobium fredii]|uniref:hypothetical protein n=1 Tax=Rhizobium fredii TaxID=380 RepID=UPI001AEEAE86
CRALLAGPFRLLSLHLARVTIASRKTADKNIEAPSLPGSCKHLLPRLHSPERLTGEQAQGETGFR